MNIIHQLVTPKQQIYFYLVAGLIWLCLGLLYLAYLSPITFPLDDAYITLHNAQVLHWDSDPNYLGTPALVGSTSIVHTSIVSLFLFWLSPEKAVWFVQWISIFLYVCGLLRLAFIYNASCWQVLLLLMTTLTMGYQSYHLLNGLETALAMSGVTWSLVLVSLPITRWQRILLSVLCGILPFLRPELTIWSFLLLLYQSYRYWQSNRSLTNSVQDVLFALVSAVPWLVFYWVNTGRVFPTTLQAKLAFYAFFTFPLTAKLLIAKKWLMRFISDVGFLGFFAALCLLLTNALGRIALIFILVFFSSYIFYFADGLTFNYGRYLCVLFPLFFYGWLIGLKHRDKNLRVGTGFVLVITLLQALWLLPPHWRAYTSSRTYTMVELASVAQWLQQHVPNNSTLLIHDAGYLAYATHFHLIDMVGLKTPSSVYLHQQYTLPSQRKQLVVAISQIGLQSHSDYLVVLKGWNEGLKIVPRLQALHWQLQLVRSSEQGYEVYKIN